MKEEHNQPPFPCTLPCVLCENSKQGVLSSTSTTCTRHRCVQVVRVIHDSSHVITFATLNSFRYYFPLAKRFMKLSALLGGFCSLHHQKRHSYYTAIGAQDHISHMAHIDLSDVQDVTTQGIWLNVYSQAVLKGTFVDDDRAIVRGIPFCNCP